MNTDQLKWDYLDKVVNKYTKWADRAEDLNTWNAHYGINDEAHYHLPEACWYCKRDRGEVQ